MKTNALMEECHATRTESYEQDSIPESRMEESMGNIVSSAKSGLGSFTSMVRRIFRITGFVLAVAALTVTVLYLTGTVLPLIERGLDAFFSTNTSVPKYSFSTRFNSS